MSAVHDKVALLARVREDIDNAKENGWDFFGDPEHAAWTDEQIADNMADCTDGYEDVSLEDHIAAVAAVRKERTT